jgi:thiamine biosynthesis lipoprotein
LEIDDDRQTIFFRRPGMELNFGSIGKGLALDLCSATLDRAGVSDYLAHGGHSSMIARGHRDLSGTGDEGWWVALRHPLRPERVLVEIQLKDRALGTSGSGRQFFYHRGTRYGHVLDPRRGRPAEGVLSATVLSPSAEVADALATAFFVMGPDAAEAYCAQYPELSALFVMPDKRRGAVRLVPIQMHDELRIPEMPAG